MVLARIVGTVVATRKDPRLVSNKLLLARPVDPRDRSRLEGGYLVAVDTVDAGVGETVLIVSGSSARMAAGMKDCPVDAAVVGIVDAVRSQRVASMQIARVIGDVVATRKEPTLEGVKLLLVQPVALDGSDAGRPLVAVDSVGAGIGEHVFFVRGKEASFPFYPVEVPADAGIVGIVDHWSSEAGLNPQSQQ